MSRGDVFFVISGFLITRNIVVEMDRGRFSLLEFYRRRAKRIVPAMRVVVGVEEQFYLCWSLLLMASYRVRRARLSLLLAGHGRANFLSRALAAPIS